MYNRRKRFLKNTHNNIKCHVEYEIDDEYGQYVRSEIRRAND